MPARKSIIHLSQNQMKTKYSQYYSIVEAQNGAPFTPDSQGVPFVQYHFPSGPIDLDFLKEIVSEVRYNCKTLGFALEGSDDSPFVTI